MLRWRFLCFTTFCEFVYITNMLYIYKMLKKLTLVLICGFLLSQSLFAGTSAKIEEGQALLENDFVKVVFDLEKGTYSVFDKKANALNAKDIYFSLNDFKSKDGFKFSATSKDIKDNFGEGVVLSIEGTKGNDGIGLNIYLYDNDGMLALENAIKADKEFRVMNFSPMMGQVFASEKNFTDFRVLGGDSGEYDTQVIFAENFKDTTHRANEDLEVRVHIVDNKYEVHNNILFTFGEKGSRQSLVYGGLSYKEFVKKVYLEKRDNSFFVELKAFDPVGKLVDANSSYTFAGDKFYFDFSETNRFKALEDYGQALKIANNVVLDDYALTGLNFWYCMHERYGGDYFSNSSTGTVEALKKSASVGFLRYGALGIRLEPDSYAKPNNQQGWWDDEHFRRDYKTKQALGGQLLPPLDTIEKWGKAIIAEGGVPLIYSQTGRRSLDYAEAFPEHMLFNEVSAPKKDKTRVYHITDPLWTYDFTDEGFIAHMRDVYANYAKGGLIGVKFDYPDTGWAFEGGFEDKYATTTSAYRNIFALAREGLGENSDIHERIPRHGDVALGIVTTQRVERDTDRFYPTFARKCGLRWYKNRVVTKYVNDVINPEHSFPYNEDGSRAFYTMSYLTNARMEIGKYIEMMSEEHRHQLTRVTPLYNNLGSAKPVDAFNDGVHFPQIFDLKINEDWHQVCFYNTQLEQDLDKAKAIYDKMPREPKYDKMISARNALIKQKDKSAYEQKKDIYIENTHPTSRPYTNMLTMVGLLPAKLSVPFGEADEDGGLGLDKAKSYYVYDFWNNCFVGKFKGSDTLAQDLRMGEARMMSVHAVQNNPQFISTDRHILQGYVDMLILPKWDDKAKTLIGTSAVIEKDPYKIIIALNGSKITKLEAKGAKAEFKLMGNDLAEITLNADKNTDVEWTISF